MTKALVTGGAGFIASHIVEGLLETGAEVIVIDNLSSGRKENLSPRAKMVMMDIRSEKVAELIAEEKPDLVVHAAAQISVRKSMEDPVFDADVNVRGLLNILHSFSGRKLPYFVFISTGGAIYGEQDFFPATEDHPIRPTSVYGMAKRVSELYLDLWHRVYGMKYAVLRLANVYGPRQNPHGEAGVVAIFSERLLRGEVPTINGSGEQTRDFVFVRDVARAVVSVCEQGVSGVYNIGTGVETSVNELYRLIAAAAQSSISPGYVEGKAGEQMRSSIDSSEAGKAFGWKAMYNLEEGIKETVAWFREQAV